MLQAIGDRIIVNLDECEKNSSLYSLDEPIRNSGTIVSVGAKVVSVKPGQHILFHNFDELPLPQKNQVVIRESSILGIYTE